MFNSWPLPLIDLLKLSLPKLLEILTATRNSQNFLQHLVLRMPSYPEQRRQEVWEFLLAALIFLVDVNFYTIDVEFEWWLYKTFRPAVYVNMTTLPPMTTTEATNVTAEPKLGSIIHTVEDHVAIPILSKSYPRGVIFSREFNLATWEFFNVKMCHN